MNVCIRVDASIEIGTGHLMRCLTLAKELAHQGNYVFFISRVLPGNLINYTREQGFTVYTIGLFENEEKDNHLIHSAWLKGNLKRDAKETKAIMGSTNKKIDWVVVDHYALDENWEKEVKKVSSKILVIDDLADRKHYCNVLLDQNYYSNLKDRYTNIIPNNTILLLGPKYALLRNEFIIEKKKLKVRNHEKRAILVFLGGSDPLNVTLKILTFLKGLNYNSKINVVIGGANPNKELIKNFCSGMPEVFYHEQIDNMAQLMIESDFAICAGGSTTWERYCLGIPAILIAVAHNQITICESIQSFGIDLYLGKASELTHEKFENALYKMEQYLSTAVKTNSMDIIDGLGKKRVITQMNKMLSGETE